MKKIQLKCKCGSEINLVDEQGSYLRKGGERDEKGRLFLIERQADDWLDRHRECLGTSET